MKNSLQAISLPALFGRWYSLDDRNLWALLVGLVALYLMLISILTQPPDVVLNLVLVMGGALLVLHAPPSAGSLGRVASGAGLGWPCWWPCSGSASAS